MGMFDDLLPASAPQGGGGMFDDLMPKGGPSITKDIAAEGGKGLVRGAEGFVGDLGEAAMGPFGPSHHLGNLMADLGLGTRPKAEPTYGQQLAKATGVEASPKTTYGKFAGSIGEVAGNPASYAGPGGLGGKLLGAAATGAGSEAAREFAPEGWEGPASVAGGLLSGYGAGAISATAANVMRARGIPTTDQLHQAATSAYTNARNLGVEYQPNAVINMRDALENYLLQQGHRDDLSSGTFRRIQELGNSATGINPNFSDIEGVRQSLNMVREEVHPNTGRPTADSRAAGVAIDFIDHFLSDPANAIPSHRAAAQQTAQFAEEGRGNWAAMSRSRQIEQALSRGDLNAGTSGSGSNIDNALRQQIKQILNNPRRAKNFTQDDRDIMRDIALGNPVRNSARLLGKMAATGIVSAAGIEYLSHVMGFGVVGQALLPGAGLAAKKAGDFMTRARIGRLQQGIRMDSPLGRANPVPPRASPAPFVARAAATTPFGTATDNPYQP